jgi:hypothetical protein
LINVPLSLLILVGKFTTGIKLKLVYQALVQSILLYGAETWTLNTQQANRLMATEMDFWRRTARKSRKEKVRNCTIRAIMEVGKNILEVN